MPVKIPASAHLDNRWNQALDLLGTAPMFVSERDLAQAWVELGPDQLLAELRALAMAGGEMDAGAA